jgi:hypothetical protein
MNHITQPPTKKPKIPWALEEKQKLEQYACFPEMKPSDQELKASFPLHTPGAVRAQLTRKINKNAGKAAAIPNPAIHTSAIPPSLNGMSIFLLVPQ